VGVGDRRAPHQFVIEKAPDTADGGGQAVGPRDVFLEIVAFVNDIAGVGAGYDIALVADVQAQQSVVGHDHVGLFGLLAGFEGKTAVPVRAASPQAVVAISADQGAAVGWQVKGKFFKVAGEVGPGKEGVVDGLDSAGVGHQSFAHAFRRVPAEIVADAFEGGKSEGTKAFGPEKLGHLGQVLAGNLVLQRLVAGGNQDAFAVLDHREGRRDKVGH